MFVPNGSWRLPKSMRGRLRARMTLTWSVPFCALDAPPLLLVVLDEGGDVTVFNVAIFCFFGLLGKICLCGKGTRELGA